ncbi:MAG: EF-hand domain-containing protein [Planctomycetota bacterium]|nr:EF-hand domain-containing protein [Planctomycetota bacterium]
MRIRPVALLAVLAASASAAHAQYSITWSVIGGGGNTVPSTGGAYAVAGTIGQAAASSVGAGQMSGGGYAVNSGFWVFGNACPADFNADGFLTFEDFDAFVGAFESGAPNADFNLDGFLTFEDFDAFVAAFESGC